MQRLLGWFHALVGWPIFCFWTFCSGVGIAVGAVLSPFDRLQRVGALSLALGWGRLMWWTQPFWQRAFVGLDALGPGPYVFVCNHQSVIDIPAMFGLPQRIKVVTKTANFRIPIMGPFVRLSGQIGTDSFFEDGRQALAEGISLVVFAEGHRSVDGELQRFKKGAFTLAAEAGVPVVPVAIDGSRLIMAKKKFVPTQLGVPVVVTFGAPITGTDENQLRKAAHEAVRQMLETMRGRVVFEPKKAA